MSRAGDFSAEKTASPRDSLSLSPLLSTRWLARFPTIGPAVYLKSDSPWSVGEVNRDAGTSRCKLPLDDTSKSIDVRPIPRSDGTRIPCVASISHALRSSSFSTAPTRASSPLRKKPQNFPNVSLSPSKGRRGRESVLISYAFPFLQSTIQFLIFPSVESNANIRVERKKRIRKWKERIRKSVLLLSCPT